MRTTIPAAWTQQPLFTAKFYPTRGPWAVQDVCATEFQHPRTLATSGTFHRLEASTFEDAVVGAAQIARAADPGPSPQVKPVMALLQAVDGAWWASFATSATSQATARWQPITERTWFDVTERSADLKALVGAAGFRDLRSPDRGVWQDHRALVDVLLP